MIMSRLESVVVKNIDMKVYKREPDPAQLSKVAMC